MSVIQWLLIKTDKFLSNYQVASHFSRSLILFLELATNYSLRFINGSRNSGIFSGFWRPFLPPANEVSGKVTFLHLFVILGEGEGVLSQHALQVVSQHTLQEVLSQHVLQGGAIPVCITGGIPACLARGRVCSQEGAWSGGVPGGGVWSRGDVCRPSDPLLPYFSFSFLLTY